MIFFVARLKENRKERFQWNVSDTAIVQAYFRDWITTATTGLPKKRDIIAFLRAHTSIVCDWTKVRNKVVNERMAFLKRRNARLLII